MGRKKKSTEVEQILILNSHDNGYNSISDWFVELLEKYNIKDDQIIVQMIHEWMIRTDHADVESTIHDYQWDDPYKNVSDTLTVKFKYNE